MDLKSTCDDSAPCTSQETSSIPCEEGGKCKDQIVKVESKKELQYFQCEVCALRECYDYFGTDPPFIKHYKLSESAYVIEDPFVPPKQSEFIILGSHCIQCNKSVCKDSNCSLYYEGTYCIHCAKSSMHMFPESVQGKLNRIII